MLEVRKLLWVRTEEADRTPEAITSAESLRELYREELSMKGRSFTSYLRERERERGREGGGEREKERERERERERRMKKGGGRERTNGETRVLRFKYLTRVSPYTHENRQVFRSLPLSLSLHYLSLSIISLSPLSLSLSLLSISPLFLSIISYCPVFVFVSWVLSVLSAFASDIATDL
jgi:hypothetical protein